VVLVGDFRLPDQGVLLKARKPLESVLRDIDRERSKMQADVDNLNRHYEKLAGYVRQYIEQTTVEWAKLVAGHPRALLLVVETTRIVDEHGNSYGEEEPIRLTTLLLASGEMWDQLLHPTHSSTVRGVEYHGLTMADLEEKPRIADVWPNIANVLGGRHLIVFGADYARKALQPYATDALDSAFCLHNKCKEYYGEFYELGLEKILGYQGIDKKRDELKNSQDRILMLAQVVKNLATHMAKQTGEPEVSEDESLDEHPF